MLEHLNIEPISQDSFDDGNRKYIQNLSGSDTRGYECA